VASRSSQRAVQRLPRALCAGYLPRPIVGLAAVPIAPAVPVGGFPASLADGRLAGPLAVRQGGGGTLGARDLPRWPPATRHKTAAPTTTPDTIVSTSSPPLRISGLVPMPWTRATGLCQQRHVAVQPGHPEGRQPGQPRLPVDHDAEDHHQGQQQLAHHAGSPAAEPECCALIGGCCCRRRHPSAHPSAESLWAPQVHADPAARVRAGGR
jgi:hypothetical protein